MEVYTCTRNGIKISQNAVREHLNTYCGKKVHVTTKTKNLHINLWGVLYYLGDDNYYINTSAQITYAIEFNINRVISLNGQEIGLSVE